MGQATQSLVEIDRVLFDQQLREGAPGGDVWLDVALVHPAGLPSRYRCLILTRFSLADKKVTAAVAMVQERWSQEFGADFFKQGDAKPYVYSPASGKVTRAYGARSRYAIANEVFEVYQYLDVVAHAWDWVGADRQASVLTVRKSILENSPRVALDLFAETSTGASLRKGAKVTLALVNDAPRAAQQLLAAEGRLRLPQDTRPKLNFELVDQLGRELGYISRSGRRQVPRRTGRDGGEIDKRLLPLVAKILATRHRKRAATLLRMVVRPTLLADAFAGFAFESTEHVVRPRVRRSDKRDLRKGTGKRAKTRKG